MLRPQQAFPHCNYSIHPAICSYVWKIYIFIKYSPKKTGKLYNRRQPTNIEWLIYFLMRTEWWCNNNTYLTQIKLTVYQLEWTCNFQRNGKISEINSFGQKYVLIFNFFCSSRFLFVFFFFSYMALVVSIVWWENFKM